MPKILLIKTSSLGEVIHTLPALTDLQKNIPNAEITWVVEEAYQEIPRWHGAQVRVLPFALRRWLRKWRRLSVWRKEIPNFFRALRAENYDYIVDAQGLIKSGMVARCARGPRYGFAQTQLREPLARFVYQHKIQVPPEDYVHAVPRTRAMFASIFNYALPKTTADASIREYFMNSSVSTVMYPAEVLLLHGAAWPNKHWPEIYWYELAKSLAAHHVTFQLPWGNATERARAERIVAVAPDYGQVLPRTTLAELGQLMLAAKAVVTVDAGLAHLAAALKVPTISLYGPTAAERTGTYGVNQHHLHSSLPCVPCLQDTCRYANTVDAAHFPPCLAEIKPQQVLQALRPWLMS
jgi:heptosyltransferase-1